MSWQWRERVGFQIEFMSTVISNCVRRPVRMTAMTRILVFFSTPASNEHTHSCFTSKLTELKVTKKNRYIKINSNSGALKI